MFCARILFAFQVGLFGNQDQPIREVAKVAYSLFNNSETIECASVEIFFHFWGKNLFKINNI